MRIGILLIVALFAVVSRNASGVAIPFGIGVTSVTNEGEWLAPTIIVSENHIQFASGGRDRRYDAQYPLAKHHGSYAYVYHDYKPFRLTLGGTVDLLWNDPETMGWNWPALAAGHSVVAYTPEEHSVPIFMSAKTSVTTYVTSEASPGYRFDSAPSGRWWELPAGGTATKSTGDMGPMLAHATKDIFGKQWIEWSELQWGANMQYSESAALDINSWTSQWYPPMGMAISWVTQIDFWIDAGIEPSIDDIFEKGGFFESNSASALSFSTSLETREFTARLGSIYGLSSLSSDPDNMPDEGSGILDYEWIISGQHKVLNAIDGSIDLVWYEPGIQEVTLRIMDDEGWWTEKTISVNVVPEPASLSVLALTSISLLRRRRA